MSLAGEVRREKLVDSRARLSRATRVWLGVWMCGLFVAMAGLWRYKLTPGPGSSTTPAAWPAESRLQVRPHTPTLVLFAHPMCACTRATLSELRAMLPRFGDRITAKVVFLEPAGAAVDWTQSETWKSAAEIPNLGVIADRDGREASLFGATTSGHVVLFSRTGRLLFSGGVTPARGHVGGSPQLSRLTQLLESETEQGPPQPRLASAPTGVVPVPVPGAVYGCPLGDPAR